MRNTGCTTILLILVIFGLILCSGCTQKAGPAPLAGETPGPQTPPGLSDTGGPGQPGPGMPGPGPAGGPCPPAQMPCGDRCIDPAHDAANCGSCGNACPAGHLCNNGQCGAGSPGVPGAPVTPGIPGTPSTPGIPGTTTTPGTVATTGTSGTTSCSSGLTNCGGSCVNTQTSIQHCGKCNSPCSSGQSCSGGKCGNYAVAMTLGPQALCTASGKLWCSGTCVSQDSSNCGSCGNKCAAGQGCSGGSCGLYWSGTWYVGNFANSPITLVQSGNSVSGTSNSVFCSGESATITGTTSGNPPVAKGSWDCPYWKESGTFTFTMAAAGKTSKIQYTTKASPGLFSMTDAVRQ